MRMNRSLSSRRWKLLMVSRAKMCITHHVQPHVVSIGLHPLKLRGFEEELPSGGFNQK
jgi:hypothetical protein